MSSATFYVLVNFKGTFKEFVFQIPKKYHYETALFDYVDFATNKLLEYNVLVDYIKNNKIAIREKWNLSENEFAELIDGLKLVLIRDFSTCGLVRKIFLKTAVLLKGFVNRILRSVKKC